MPPQSPRFILASASPARLSTLRSAGIDPTVHVSGVDESGVVAEDPTALVMELARLKGEAVLEEVGTTLDLVLVACDSVLDIDGVVFGKPVTDDQVRQRWATMSGRSGHLVTGHHVVVVREGAVRRATRVAATTVRFARVSPEEVDAYIATGEPHHVAGAFTIDGYGSAFVEGVDGDPHNVVGISVPLLRDVLGDLGVRWTDLWATPAPSG